MSKAAARSTPLFNALEVRAHFVLRGTSCHQWARTHGFKFRHLYQILSGQRHGLRPEGKRIVMALRRELRSGQATGKG